MIIRAPIHHKKFVLSLNIKQPRNPETIKFEAVAITVVIKVLESLE